MKGLVLFVGPCHRLVAKSIGRAHKIRRTFRPLKLKVLIHLLSNQEGVKSKRKL